MRNKQKTPSCENNMMGFFLDYFSCLQEWSLYKNSPFFLCPSSAKAGSRCGPPLHQLLQRHGVTTTHNNQNVFVRCQCLVVQVQGRQSRAACGFDQDAVVGQKTQARADGLGITDLNAGGGMGLADGIGLVTNPWCPQRGGDSAYFV